MADVRINEKNLMQILTDAGCDKELAEQCMKLSDETSNEKMLILLKHHRSTLLSDIHDKQDKLYCLDYLMYQLKKQNGGSK